MRLSDRESTRALLSKLSKVYSRIQVGKIIIYVQYFRLDSFSLLPTVLLRR
jgi:hypothetical protein